MTAIEAARKVYTEKSCHLLRPRKDEPAQYDVKDAFTGKKRGWFYLDLFTASAIVKVHEAVNESNRAKLEKLPITTLARICFQMVS
jgi:hypothetical protein